MLKKPFVSLSFSSRRLQILKLDSRKTAIEGFTSIDLPEGMIRNYQIKDKKSLSTLLVNAWQNLQLKEKSVAIVIPEFSTFTKSLIMPQLSVSELDEAVRWQARDFLPSDYQKVVMDWKIVKREDDTIRILVIAVQKELLSVYVDAVGEAGLYPLAVETPSLSLERITDGTEIGRLVIYTNFGEAILAVLQGKEILGSSVVSSTDVRGIVWTAMQMVRHYQNIKIQRIEVGGLEITEEVLSQLREKTKLKVEWIQANIAGLSAEQIQEYLIPISLQFKDPAEPISQETLNLLPSKWVKHYQNKRLKLQVWSLLLVTTLIIIGCFLATLFVYLFLSRQIKILEAAQVDQANSVSEEITAQINSINGISNKTFKIISSSQSTQAVVDKINGLKPQGITISDYQLDFDTGRIVLKGQSVHREILIKFKQALETDEDFGQISMPISNLEQETDLEFELRGYYLKALSKKPIKIQIK